MSKKVDLNAPRNNLGGHRKSNNNHSFSNWLKNRNSNKNTENEQNAVDTDVTNNQNTSNKIGSVADAKDKVKAIIKSPIKAKIILILAIMAIPIIILGIFTTFISAASSGSTSDGFIALKHSCNKITITNTDCDSNGENCSNKYDGDIEFDDYIAGTIAGIADGANSVEFYKALAIVVRTNLASILDDSCSIDANLNYIDVDNAKDRGNIKEAISGTENLVLTNDDNELVDTSYSYGCVVGKDNNNYYLRNGSAYLEKSEIQTIPISWSNVFADKLNTLSQSVNMNEGTVETRACPGDNYASEFSLIGAAYLAQNENYSYEEIIKEYYGDTKIIKAEASFDGTISDAGLMNPLKKIRCTSKFGFRIHPITGVGQGHSGIDMTDPSGDWTIYAAKAGKVTTVVSDINYNSCSVNTCGNYIIIDHGDGLKTRYCHILYGGIPDYIRVGAEVEQGEAIAIAGSTGCSTGRHLHFMVYVNGSLANPANYIDLTEALGQEHCGITS